TLIDVYMKDVNIYIRWKLVFLIFVSFSSCNTFRGVSSSTDGFETIFDGRSLNGWEGDSTYWRVEDGNMVGEVTPATLLDRNSFIIWREGTVSDFEFKAQYRVSPEGN